MKCVARQNRSLVDMIDCYASKEECERANSNNINVVRFQDYKEEY